MRQRTKKTVTYGKANPSKIQRYTSGATGAAIDNGASTDPPVPHYSAPSTRRSQSGRGHHLDADEPNNTEKNQPSAIYPIAQKAEKAEQRGDYTDFRTKRRRLAKHKNSHDESPIGLRKPKEPVEDPSLDHAKANAIAHEVDSPGKDGMSDLRKGSPDTALHSSSVHRSPRPEFKSSNQESYSETTSSRLPALSAVKNRRYNNTTPPRRRLVDHLAIAEGYASAALEEDELPWDPAARFSPSVSKANACTSPRAPDSRNCNLDTPQEPNSPVPPGLRGSRVTYARQRSFLNDISQLNEAEVLGMPPGQVQPPLSSGGAHMTSSHISDDEANDSRPVRSIHELRQAGDNARFRETVETIFEDIDNSYGSIQERCSGFVQLCENTLNPEFVRRFLEYNFGERLSETMREDLDITSASLSICAYRMVCAGSPFPYALVSSFWHRLLGLASGLIEIDENISVLLKETHPRLSRAVQTSLKSLLPRLSSLIFEDPSTSKMSPQFLILSSIQHTLEKLRVNGDRIEPMPASLLKRLVGLLSSENSATVQFPMHPQTFERVASVFSILEAYTGSSGPLDRDQCDAFRPLRHLHHLLRMGQCDQSRELLLLYVRVTLNLTNKDLLLCNELATSPILSGFIGIITAGLSDVNEDTLAKEDNSLNTVILSLGALINLAEKSDSSRALFLTAASESQSSFLQILLQQFSTDIDFIDQAHSVPEMRHNVALGYLAVLIVTLCLNEEAIPYVERSLNGKGLRLALSTAGEFLEYHQKVEQALHPWEARDEKGTQFTTRLKHIISQIYYLPPSINCWVSITNSYWVRLAGSCVLVPDYKMPAAPKQRKIAIVGSRSVGKSSLTVRFVEHHFVESYYPTIENTFSRIINHNGQDFATEIVDTAGQDEYSILNSKHFIGIHGYIIVYSVASRQSFDMVRVIRDKILNHLGADYVSLVVVGNKSDLKNEQRQVSSDEGRQLGEEFHCAFTEASARLGYNVDRAFELMIGEIEKSQNPAQPPGGNKCNVM
ncbi:hypothetical protein FE257_004377 [Aspergillus nanangensis]|uniref:Wings apart-like protein C-terminal domain-containing protein n=1 Tax=Aspergillus nanangensis TaxID=2582783 RepID=A0AAD4GP48_ASPNN|nr:hypothetical protein FE257_004377 [Aspergillus nanangensis]